MISKLFVLTGLVLANVAFAADTTSGISLASTPNHLTVATINDDKGMFSVRELHDMGTSGVQQIDYVVNCANQTLALAGFAVVNSKARLTSNAKSSSVLSFYKPVIEHDQKIASNVCNKLVTMNNVVTQ